jgi:peptide/nickel transport system permease protein
MGSFASDGVTVMTQYIARRLISMVFVLIFVSMAVFVLIRVLPGDPVAALVGTEGALDQESREALEEDLGLNDPLIVQYLDWVGGILTGDWGRSIRSRQPVLEALGERIPATFQIQSLAIMVALGIGIPVGVASAIKSNTWVDRVLSMIALSGVAMPNFWLALLLILLLAVQLELLPPSGYVNFWDDPVEALKYAILPALTGGLLATATIMRQVRSSMLEVLRQDYVRTARAKGLHERRVVVSHALRNALLPVVTVIGLLVGQLLGGSVIIEQVFAIPGVGRMAADSIFQRDFPVLQGVVLVAATLVVVMNLVTDLAYGILDPRIRFS